MAYERKDNSGSLFRNDRKEKDTHADYRGEAMIDGVQYWIDAWLNESQRGKYMNIKFKLKEQRASEIRQQSSYDPDQGSGSYGADDDGETIPF